MSRLHFYIASVSNNKLMYIKKYILYMYRYEISKETFPQKYLDNKFSKCNRLLYEEMF